MLEDIFTEGSKYFSYVVAHKFTHHVCLLVAFYTSHTNVCSHQVSHVIPSPHCFQKKSLMLGLESDKSHLEQIYCHFDVPCCLCYSR